LFTADSSIWPFDDRYDQVAYGEEDEEELDDIFEQFNPEINRYNQAMFEIRRVKAYCSGQMEQFERDAIEHKWEILKQRLPFQDEMAEEIEEKRLMLVKAAQARVQADQEARRDRVCPAAPRKMVRTLSGDVREWAEGEESVDEDDEEYLLEARVGLLSFVAME